MDLDVLFPPLPGFIKVLFTKPFWSWPKIFFNLFTVSDEKITSRLKQFGVNDVQLVDSGTSGLFLALKELDLRSSGEVVLPSFVCKCVVNVIIAAGGRPVFADIDGDFNVSPESVSKAITKNTKAVIAVHQYGRACRIDEIQKICQKHKLVLIEDSAIPIGLKFKDKYVGSFGDYAVYSFNIGKTIVAFGGGVFIRKNTSPKVELGAPKSSKFWFFLTNVCYKRFFGLFYSLLLKLGLSRREENIQELYERVNERELKFVPSEMSRLQKATLLYQLDNLGRIIENHKKIADVYYEELAGVKQIVLPTKENNLFTLFPIIIDNRYSLAKYLSAKGIETQWTFYPLHLQGKFKEFVRVPLMNTEKLWKKELSLPMSPVMSVRQARFVCQKIKEYYSKGVVV